MAMWFLPKLLLEILLCTLSLFNNHFIVPGYCLFVRFFFHFRICYSVVDSAVVDNASVVSSAINIQTLGAE